MIINSKYAEQLAKELASSLSEFQATQRRKERYNIVSALYKMRKGETLNKRENEALERYIDFICTTAEAEVNAK